MPLSAILEDRIALPPEGVCRNGVRDVSGLPITDLKPLELVLVHRSNGAPIADRIAIGIANSVRGDELARTAWKSLVQTESKVVT